MDVYQSQTGHISNVHRDKSEQPCPHAAEHHSKSHEVWESSPGAQGSCRTEPILPHASGREFWEMQTDAGRDQCYLGQKGAAEEQAKL